MGHPVHSLQTPYLVRSVQPPLVGDRGFALPLHDGLQLRQLVLHEQRLLEVRLALHHDDVRLGVDADPGNVFRPLFRVDPHCDATEEERECTRYEIVNLVNVTWQFSAVRTLLMSLFVALATMQILDLPNHGGHKARLKRAVEGAFGMRLSFSGIHTQFHGFDVSTRLRVLASGHGGELTQLTPLSWGLRIFVSECLTKQRLISEQLGKSKLQFFRTFVSRLPCKNGAQV